MHAEPELDGTQATNGRNGYIKTWVFFLLLFGGLAYYTDCPFPSLLDFPFHACRSTALRFGRLPAALQAQKPTTTTRLRRRKHHLRDYHDATLSSNKTGGLQ